MRTKSKEENLSESIRDAVARVPTLRLQRARPCDIYPSLEEQGIKITPSVMAMTSKWLVAAKRQMPTTRLSDRYEDVSNEQVMAALCFAKACGGIKHVKKVIKCLEGLMDLFDM